jgi:hypothetical protein
MFISLTTSKLICTGKEYECIMGKVRLFINIYCSDVMRSSTFSRYQVLATYSLQL